ncbi:DUF401 family protein [Sporosalibacterium faouarense]|uniref:DUF401 family protein n=1 Tax=Sporosalibacterium faouarense TaxID=516123 RepID=UPI00192C5CC0|nr:DUF401 family protein [Sporosalibacterium faouarense]
MAIITLIISITVVLIIVSKKVNIGYSLMIGAVLLALLNKMSPIKILSLVWQTFSDYSSVTLAITIGLITILSHLMDKYLILDRMISSLEKVLRSAKITILFTPAIIGTLLVTGGALMSCPVVDKLGDKLNLPNDKRASINLIFRHALYFVYPLSPAIILAAEVGNINLWDFIKLQFPITIVMYILGYIFLLRKCDDTKPEKTSLKEYMISIKEFLLYASPILISLLGVIVLRLPFYISLLFGILISISINIYDKRQDSKYDTNQRVFKTIFQGLKIPMVVAILGIMLFKNVVNNIDEIYVQLNGFLDKGIPLELLIIIGCAVISFSMASTQPSIALLFPMILPLATSYGMKLNYAMFIYVSAFTFYYISPLHLCQVLTIEYFDVKVKNLYKNYVYILPITYLSMIVIYLLNIF